MTIGKKGKEAIYISFHEKSRLESLVCRMYISFYFLLMKYCSSGCNIEQSCLVIKNQVIQSSSSTTQKVSVKCDFYASLLLCSEFKNLFQLSQGNRAQCNCTVVNCFPAAKKAFCTLSQPRWVLFCTSQSSPTNIKIVILHGKCKVRLFQTTFTSCMRRIVPLGLL